MSLRINNNISALSAHRNLKNNDDRLTRTLEKLSSGLQVSRAADGPAKLVISEQMRAQIGGLQQSIDNSETAISLVQTTEANMGEISSLLTGIRQLAIHAANEGANDEIMLQADQNELRNALDTINRISAQAQFGNKRLLDGSNGASGFTTGEALEFVGASLKTKDSSEHGFDVKITQNATRAGVIGETALTQEVVAAGEKLTVIENGKMASYTSNANDTVATAVQNLRSEVERNGLEVNVTVGDDGVVSIQHRQYGSDYGFQVMSSTAGVLSRVAEEIESTNNGLDIKGTINGESAVGNGRVLTGITGASCVDGLSVRYSGTEKIGIQEECVVYDRVDENAEDQPAEAEQIPAEGKSVGRAFVTQKSLKFQVGANQGQTVGISLGSTHSDNLARGVLNISGFRSLNEVDVTSFQGATDTLALVDEAINGVTQLRGSLGAFQKNTLESNLSNLRVANENLISAESIIRDVDMAAEMAEFTKHQIMMQSSTAMLAQANQIPPNVLRLLN
ncbi:MAG: flagellin [Deltaproteobacteria bacterium]|nr:flagellin [Deltaproteobacteria bacterium]MBT4642365.1 flagellin [Deltaproteobacteria bacterium]MBT6500672.1 flagellin [Deltaproteobacteria bacterium]MBT7154063.1 flagellin [Deltaproteobacteria bacterium]MBT7713316.1 flagellin [Deltaproteobacteria bacterium]